MNVQFCLLLTLVAAVLCTNTSAPLLDAVWSADLTVRESDTNVTSPGFIQTKYDEDHQFMHYVFKISGAEFGVAWFMAHDVIGVWYPGAGAYECSHDAYFKLTIPRDVLQTAEYVKTVRGADIFRDGRHLQGTKDVFYKVPQGTNKIVEFYVTSDSPSDNKDMVCELSNHSAKIDRQWVDVHATCPNF